MLDYARHRLSHVEEQIHKGWPERAPIIREALSAHRHHRYALSIPTLLAQADGMAGEVLGVSVYGRKGGEPQARKAYRKRISPKFADAHPWTLMFTPLELVSSWNERIEAWRTKREIANALRLFLMILRDAVPVLGKSGQIHFRLSITDRVGLVEAFKHNSAIIP
jgi:hypothetical protein